MSPPDGRREPITYEQAFALAPIVAIVRGVRPDEVEGVAQALCAGGVRIVEVPMNSPDPLDSIRRLKAFSSAMVHGAGTVLTIEAAEQVAEAGGRIIVSPDTNAAVIRRTVELGLTASPGFGTASEAFQAYLAGARYLKLFPAATYGPGHLKALKAVLPKDAVVLPVGGVGPAQMADWWAAGARGFGLGSELYKPGMGLDEIEARARAACDAVRALTDAA